MPITINPLCFGSDIPSGPFLWYNAEKNLNNICMWTIQIRDSSKSI